MLALYFSQFNLRKQLAFADKDIIAYKFDASHKARIFFSLIQMDHQAFSNK